MKKIFKTLALALSLVMGFTAMPTVTVEAAERKQYTGYDEDTVLETIVGQWAGECEGNHFNADITMDRLVITTHGGDVVRAVDWKYVRSGLVGGFLCASPEDVQDIENYGYITSYTEYYNFSDNNGSDYMIYLSKVNPEYPQFVIKEFYNPGLDRIGNEIITNYILNTKYNEDTELHVTATEALEIAENPISQIGDDESGLPEDETEIDVEDEKEDVEEEKPILISPEPESKRDVAEDESIYTVVKGDCLWSIARKLLGREILYKELFDRNSDIIKVPELIYPGQEIIYKLTK